ncbi:MAG: energy-coupling factor transporter ATPase [Spirochaetales bacterium]|nr:energy-coupling factor transporter ATPase [Spirochaetales bacterium]
MKYIEIKKASFAYGTEENPVVRQLSVTINHGEFAVIAGSNGSGKSTLLRLMNGLLLPQEGEVITAGMSTSNPNLILPIRKTTGMVFQNPENQLSATVVEEDVAFGPENLAFSSEEMTKAVEEALDLTGLTEQKSRSTTALSAGQLQRLALAGVLAMKPRCLLLDEPTSMLNPQARHSFMELIHRLNREKGLTVVMVSHHEREILSASRLIVMDKGQIVRDGKPKDIMKEESLEQWGLLPPPSLEAVRHLQNRGLSLPETTEEEALTDSLKSLGKEAQTTLWEKFPLLSNRSLKEKDHSLPIDVQNISHDYLKGTLLKHRALSEVSLKAASGECLCLIGTTGSGKSTLLQHLNGLLLADEGQVSLLNTILGPETRDEEVISLRRQIGLVMQRPEKQLFERFVGDDVAFAPKQAGLTGKKLARRVKWAMDLAGLPFTQFKDRPIYALSGGEKRKAALAGVLALQPRVLLLDEPSAGLDPLSRRELHRILINLREQGTTLVIATHDMDEAALLGHRIVLMERGKAVMNGSPAQVFSRGEELRHRGLEPPFIKRIEEALA